MLAEAERCIHCGCVISDDLPANHPQKATADHIITVAEGGSDSIDNLAPSCRTCNLRRGAKGLNWKDPTVEGAEEW